jgi:heme/copper-type cytochrome/quinol oxidase subunit 3
MASEGALPSPATETTTEQQHVRSLSVSARLLAGATTFFFVSFVFAYFYLRSLDVERDWRPPHVKPDQAVGAAFIACIVLSAVALIVADRLERNRSEWTALAAVSLVLGLAAVALGCIEFTVQKFGPTDGAFASIFCAWMAFYLLFVLSTMYWLEIQLATELRDRRKPKARTGQGVSEYEDPDQLLPRGLEASVFYWTFLAAIGVITYVILYLLQT